MDGSPFQPVGNFGGLAAGSYVITVIDAGGCTLDSTVEITEPAPLAILNEGITPITCAGAADGQIDVLGTGGTLPLTYTLMPGGTSNTTGVFASLSPGTYTVTVDDSQGCGPVTSSPLVLTDPPALVLDSVTQTPISCFGLGDGSLGIYVSGGVAPYSYSVDNQTSWDPGNLFSGLTPGTYDVFIQDANLCILPGGTFVLNDPPQITLTAETFDIAPCAGDDNGSIVGHPGGGTGVLELSLDGLLFQTNDTFAGLSAGAYTLYARDESGCSVTLPLTLNEPAPVSATITKTDAINGNLGTITIGGAAGGTGPYTYSIDGPSGTFTTDTYYENLVAGTYPVVVMDQNGCTFEQDVEISEVPPLTVTLQVVHNSCFGVADGSIEFIPVDAVGAVEYSIDSGKNFVNTPLFENLPGDSLYHLMARDGEGKEYRDTVTIQEPSSIQLSASVTPALCSAFSETGGIELDVSGGAGGFSFLWSDGATDEDRIGLVAGTYEVEVTDADNCVHTETFDVGSQILVEADAGNDTTVCPGVSLQLRGLGGHTPSWEPAQWLSDPTVANPIVQGLIATTSFVLTITEEVSGNGCYATDSITVSLHPETGLDAGEDTTVFSGVPLQLQATAGFDSYRWDPAAGLDDNLIANPVATLSDPQMYIVYGTNEYGCEESDSLFVDVIENLNVYNVFTPNNDGHNDYFVIGNAHLFPDMLVEVYSRWGDLLFSTVGYDSDSRWDGTSQGKEVPVGTYYYIIVPYSGARPITGNVTIIR
ncbi:MAG: gliding motility-associated C-terminal domain-containing protein [Bacteroidales bacterium]